jgi:hypothetical protein
VKYAYVCATHGLFDVPIAADSCLCPDCGDPSRRYWSVAFDRRSTRNQDRWDPQVGAFVRNDREFNEMLKAGAARQEAELGMAANLVQVDSRDTEALAELHGHSTDHRLAEKENTKRANHDERAKANKESLVIVR